MQTYSLKKKLFVRVSVLILLTLLVVGAFAFRSVHMAIDADYDAQLVTDCNVLWLLTKEDMEEKSIQKFPDIDISSMMPLQSGIYKPSLERYGNWHTFRVWKNHRIMLRSDNAEAESLPATPAGLSTISVNGSKWRVYSLHVKMDDAVIEAFENMEAREMVQGDILKGLLEPLFLLIPLVGLMLIYGINSGLRGVQRFASQVEARSPEDLSPVMHQAAPRELQPLMVAINSLLAKLRDALQRERELIDNAAHALFTPLAALKVQVELLRECNKEADRSRTILDIKSGINRAAKLIQQLLFLSRLNGQSPPLEPIKLYTETQKIVAEIAALAVDKKIELSLEGDETATVLAERELLGTLIRSIVENAIKYSPAEGKISLRLLRNERNVLLQIEDNGPGIVESEREKVFERFYRSHSVTEQGSGLGLSISKSIAEMFHADITISHSSTTHGACFTIAFATAQLALKSS